MANGEILGVSLLMEDVLMSGQQDKAVYDPTENEDDNVSERGSGNGGGNGGGSNTPSVRGSRPASALSVTKKKSKGKIDVFYKIVICFFISWSV